MRIRRTSAPAAQPSYRIVDNDRASAREAKAYGWFISLGTIAVVPNHPNLTHRYEFAVGFNVSSGGVTRSFGEDPEFDVGL